MRAIVAAMAILALGACESGPPSGFDDIASIPSELNEQGVSFGIGRVPGENALTLQVHFKISEADGAEAGPVTDEMWMKAAAAAAPAGCTVKRITPTEDGGRKAEYQC
jgi:hypothetical protein